jgi:hypothetical protein
LRSIEQQERKTLVSEVKESKKGGVWASCGHAPAPALLYRPRLELPRIAAAAPYIAVNCHDV